MGAFFVDEIQLKIFHKQYIAKKNFDNQNIFVVNTIRKLYTLLVKQFDLGVDSLDLFEMVMAMEEEFGVEIPSEDLEKIATVNDLEEYLKAKGIEAQKKTHAVIAGAIVTGNWEELQKGRKDEDKNHRTARL